MLPTPRTSPRYHRLAASHMSGSRSRMKSGSRSSRSARGMRLCTWRAPPRIARPTRDGPEPASPSPARSSAESTCPLLPALAATPVFAISAGTSRGLPAGGVAAVPWPPRARPRDGDLIARDEAHEKVVGLLGPLHLWDVAAVLDRHLLGAGQPLAHMT